jgi:hypothetical protein
MRNVDFMVDPQVHLEVRRLQGRLESTRPGELPFFDQPSSFRILVEHGEVAISTASMAAILNTYTFGYEGAPLSDVEISVHEGKLRQKGSLHKEPCACRSRWTASSACVRTASCSSTPPRSRPPASA